MTLFFLFVIGSAFGSFVGVLARRYRPDKFLFAKEIIGGRSYCPSCHHQLRWFDLIPIVSFIILYGRCRYCRAKISWDHLLIELIIGLIFVIVPLRLHSPFLSSFSFFYFSLIWVLIFLTLALISFIDWRLKIIPNETVIILCFLSFLLIAGEAFFEKNFAQNQINSFLGAYALIFGYNQNVFWRKLMAAAFAAIFLGFLILVTQGKGMGGGDLKLGLALGLVFGWPDISLIILLAFILGAFFGLGEIVLKKKNLKSFLPFGPFLSAAAAVVFLFGFKIINFYFSLFY